MHERGGAPQLDIYRNFNQLLRYVVEIIKRKTPYLQRVTGRGC